MTWLVTSFTEEKEMAQERCLVGSHLMALCLQTGFKGKAVQ